MDITLLTQYYENYIYPFFFNYENDDSVFHLNNALIIDIMKSYYKYFLSGLFDLIQSKKFAVFTPIIILKSSYSKSEHSLFLYYTNNIIFASLL